MAIDQWFDEGAAARGAGEHRVSCSYQDDEARSEWLAGFDEAAVFEVANGASAAGQPQLSEDNTDLGMQAR